MLSLSCLGTATTMYMYVNTAHPCTCMYVYMYVSPATFVVCMYVYILVYQSPLICVPHPSFILSFRIMAVVWVKLDDALPPTKVKADTDVDDLILSYVEQEKLGIGPRNFNATYNGEVLRRGSRVSEIVTSDDNPIILCRIGEDEEGMYVRPIQCVYMLYTQSHKLAYFFSLRR